MARPKKSATPPPPPQDPKKVKHGCADCYYMETRYKGFSVQGMPCLELLGR